MATIRAYTTIEQSKKLAEILPLETSDMIYTIVNGYRTPFVRIEEIIELDKDDVCAWSLTALLNVLQIYTTPTAFSSNISAPSLTKTKNGYSITYVGDYRIMESNNNNIELPIEIIADNPISACYEMILKLREQNLL